MKKQFNLVILSIFLIFLITGCSRPTPDETVQTFLNYLSAGQYAEMYQLLTVEAKQRISEQDFAAIYQDIYQKVGNLKLELEMQTLAEGEEWPVEDNRVDIPINGSMLTWTVDEIGMNQTLQMVYEEKAWRVDWQPTNILPQLTDLSYQVEVSRTSANRGNIFDRGGKQLAGPGKIYQIGLVPGKMLNWDETIYLMANLLGLSSQRIEQELHQKWVQPNLFVPLRSITAEEWSAKKNDFMSIPGMLASSQEGRIYTTPVSLAPTIGYLGEINSKELAQWKTDGYVVGDLIGRTGLEKREENYLAGKPGYMIRIVDQSDNEQALVKFTRPMHGGDVFLTIDSTLQKIIERAMGDRQGIAVAMVPNTGEVLALASFPGFDANEFTLGSSSQKINQLLNDPGNPLINRPIQSRYIPGSIFKPITALTALELYPEYDPTNKVSIPEDTWRAEAGWGSYSVRRVSRPEGPVDLSAAMKWSDNIYFAQLAYQMGSEPLFTMAKRLGFSEPIPFTLEVELSQLATKQFIPNAITLADTGYGQGQVLVTPLHMAMIYSALATDGKLRQPVLLTSEERGVIWKDNIATIEHFGLLKDILALTIQDPEAFAHSAAISGLELAGKTGTAQVGNDQETGWFVCYTPVSDPTFLLLIGIENSSKGSKEAIEVAREILINYYQLEEVTIETLTPEVAEDFANPIFGN